MPYPGQLPNGSLDGPTAANYGPIESYSKEKENGINLKGLYGHQIPRLQRKQPDNYYRTTILGCARIPAR